MKKPMKFKRYEKGGEIDEADEAKAKARGLEISNKEKPAGLFERIRAGNIDQPGSEAYNRFGAGRGRSERTPVKVEEYRSDPYGAMTQEQRDARPSIEELDQKNKPMPVARPSMKPRIMERALSDDMYSDFGPNAGRSSGETSFPSATTSKPRVVSKKELEDSGMSLRDFLNKERGLTRRKDSTPATEKKPAESKSSSPALIDPSNIRSGRRPEEEALLAPKLIDPSNIRSGRRPDEEALLKTPANAKKVKTDNRSVNERIRSSLGMKSGGSVSSASRRDDGIATKGKTRGKMC